MIFNKKRGSMMRKSKIILFTLVSSLFLMCASLVYSGGGGGGGGGDPPPPPPPQTGCYEEGTSPSLGSTSDSPGSLEWNTFKLYYPGGEGGIPPECTSPRRYTKKVCVQYVSGTTGTCLKTEEKEGNWPPSPEAPGVVKNTYFGTWVWSDVSPKCIGNKYEVVSRFEPDKSTKACGCIRSSVWDRSYQCCGDDTLDGQTPEPSDDPDLAQIFCENCYLGANQGKRMWGPSCCGDDGGDCNSVSGQYLCWNRPRAEWYWMLAPDLRGKILDSGCNKESTLSDRDGWIYCRTAFEGTENPYRVDSDYICYDYKITECCGDSTCNSLVGGVAYGGIRETTGVAFKLGDSVYYCADDLDWTTDLDIKNQNSCEKAGFSWTGTKCCSEADDPNEYHNDANNGCWDSNLTMSGNFPRGEKDVLNYHGQFYGCKIEAKNYIDDNEHLLNIKNYHPPKNNLIDNKDYCETLADGYYYCSYVEKWIVGGGEAQMHLSFVPWSTTEQKAGCCGPNNCFDGNSCLENQAYEATSSDHNGFRCVDGNWTEARLRYTPSGNTSGYCPTADQCLVDLQGDPEDNNNPSGNPQCIADEQYRRDDYCENGIWTSRTKLIALQLLDLPQKENIGNYVLFCGDYKDALNYLDYEVRDNKIAKSYITDKPNNYCVLSYGGKVVLGTSLNQEIDSGDYKFMDLIGASCSSGMTDEDEYSPCSPKKAWYNKKLKSVIYSQGLVELYEVNLFDKFVEFLKNPFVALLINKLKEKTPPYDQSFVKEIKEFKNLYINKKGDKFILGTMEGEQYKNIIVQYINFDTDVCEMVDTYNEYHSGLMSGILCSKEGKNYYVLAHGSIFTTPDPTNIWADLTSKLRVN